MEKNKNLKEIVIKIEGKEWSDALDKAFKKANAKAKIAGFRPGKSPEGKEGYYEFPIGYIDDQTNKFQSVRQNAKANQIYTVELIKSNKLNDLIIQAYEFTKGEQDLVST